MRDPQEHILPSKVLLAFDNSKEGLSAIVATVDLCERLGSELQAVPFRSKLEIPAHTTPTSDVRAAEPPIERVLWPDELRAQLEMLRSGCAAAGIDLTLSPSTVRSAKDIAKLAKGIGTSLVVLGAARHGFVRRLRGGPAPALARLAPCPVLVTRYSERSERPEWPPKRVVVGVDLSESSKRAATFAGSLAAALGAELTLALAYYRLPEAMQPQGLTALSTDEETKLRAWRWLNRLSRSLEDSIGYRPQFSILPGETVAAIRRKAEEGSQPSLTAVGARRMSRRQRALLGSVSLAVVRSFEGPVLIVPCLSAGSNEVSSSEGIGTRQDPQGIESDLSSPQAGYLKPPRERL